MQIQVKRIYESTAAADGFRVLIDRVWPRGVSKAKADLDAWKKALAPSTELRKWFGHDRQRWEAFHAAYEKELDDCDPELFEELRQHAEQEGLTLLFAAKDTECNNAVVLKDYLEKNQ